MFEFWIMVPVAADQADGALLVPSSTTVQPSKLPSSKSSDNRMLGAALTSIEKFCVSTSNAFSASTDTALAPSCPATGVQLTSPALDTVIPAGPLNKENVIGAVPLASTVESASYA